MDVKESGEAHALYMVHRSLKTCKIVFCCLDLLPVQYLALKSQRWCRAMCKEHEGS